jgi:hypothetical protein
MTDRTEGQRPELRLHSEPEAERNSELLGFHIPAGQKAEFEKRAKLEGMKSSELGRLLVRAYNRTGLLPGQGYGARVARCDTPAV